eukprot:9409-Heterococcus_DN1.PRE.6
MPVESTEARESSAGSSLLCPGILKTVLSYVGSGYFLFVTPVSRLWKKIYATVERQQLTVYIRCHGMNSIGLRARTITCGPQMTLFSSVFTSPSRVKLAHETDLNCRLTAYQHAAGKYADVTTLRAAHEVGLEYIMATIDGAARFNNLPAVQYLHSQGCHWPLQLLKRAAINGYFELVRWWHENVCTWHAPDKAPSYAAESGNVELMA